MYNLRARFEDQTSEEIARRGAELDLYSSTFLKSPPPSYDPIFTPLFTSLFGVLQLSAGATSFLVGAASAIATTAVTGGLQMGERP